MSYAVSSNLLGQQQISPFNLADATSRMQPGTLVQAVDPYWGAGEFMYVKAGGAIRQYGVVVLTPAPASGAYVFTATEAPNTANLGRPLGIAMTAMDSGDFGWICVGGVVPVNCQAAVAADTAFGIAAAGQGGANSAGKQILSARVVGASTTTVAKANSVANSGSKLLHVTNSDGWFAGIYLSGTGIAAGCTVTDISPDGTQVTLSLATTAAVNGTVTGTYNNATVYYNIAHINRPFAQGAIT